MELRELAKGYREAIQKLDARINELRNEANFTLDENELASLYRRIRILISMRADALAVEKVCLHYYERSYHPDERFTVQGPLYPDFWWAPKLAVTKRWKQRRGLEKSAEASAGGDSGGIDAAAAEDLADVLLRGEKHPGNRRRARAASVHGFSHSYTRRAESVPGAPVLLLTHHTTKGEHYGKD